MLNKIHFSCFFTCAVLTLCLGACDKSIEPNFGPPPDANSKSKIYLNGNLVSYKPLIMYGAGTTYIDYRFIQQRKGYQNVIKPVVLDPFETGDLSSVGWVFGQIKGGDDSNHQYLQINRDLTRFFITEFDTSTQVIKCSFDVMFLRRSSGIEEYESYLPDTLHFTGVIDTTFIKL
jgi:hypothetical protein